MLLINLKSCKIDECEKVGEEVEKSCVIVIVSRGKRESVVNFDRETIFVYDIGFFDVVINIRNEKSSLLIRFSNFVCFVRICS